MTDRQQIAADWAARGFSLCAAHRSIGLYVSFTSLSSFSPGT